MRTPNMDDGAPSAGTGSRGLYDAWQLRVTTQEPRAVEALNAAILSYAGHRADTLSHVDAALTVDPGLALAHLIQGFALRFLARRDLLAQAREALGRAVTTLEARGATPREAMLIEALSAFCDGDIPAAIEALSQASRAHPSCLLSTKLHHALCFMYGRPGETRRGLERALGCLSPELVGYGYVLGCYAFSLEETGAYSESERCAREALDLCATDAWAYHAWMHVMAMQDRTREGLAIMRKRGSRFDGGTNFIAHLAWHHALFAIAEGELDEAIVLYDTEISLPLGRDYRDAANGVSLLYRLERAGVDVKERWERLADLARARLGDHGLAFADAHYVLALSRAGRPEQAAAFLRAMRKSAMSRLDTDAQVARKLGIPLAQGLLWLESEPARALTALWPLSRNLLSLGGSRVQRELFQQAVIDAALVAKRSSVAAKLLADQLRERPGCQWALARSRQLTGASPAFGLHER